MANKQFCVAALGCCLSLCAYQPLHAAELALEVEIPRLNVAEYHRPYVAIWIEGADRQVRNLAVWYDLKQKQDEGSKWLKDLRQWWRKSGRELSFPVDGMTSATRAPGKHRLSLRHGDAALAQLPPGDYRLQVEAVREVGGRELLSLPFSWPPQAVQQVKAQGKEELGSVRLDLKP